jgi:hypothetical protein
MQRKDAAMRFTKGALLRSILRGHEGEVTTYFFVEIGCGALMDEMRGDGLIEVVPRSGDLDLVRITHKGRELADAIV